MTRTSRYRNCKPSLWRLYNATGDPTLSLSCSDKIAKWNVVGIQGSILTLCLTHPIYLHSIIVSETMGFDEVRIAYHLCNISQSTNDVINSQHSPELCLIESLSRLRHCHRIIIEFTSQWSSQQALRYPSSTRRNSKSPREPTETKLHQGCLSTGVWGCQNKKYVWWIHRRLYFSPLFIAIRMSSSYPL